MAHISIRDIVITSVTDPTASVKIWAQGITHSPAQQVEIRRYAGGNFRAVRQPGTQKVSALVMGACTDAQVAVLKGWQGQSVCLRDCTGEKFFGIYIDPSFARAAPGWWSVSLTATQITWSAT